MSTLIVIPARYESTRFPGKPLALIAGISLIERVYKQCILVKDADVVIATDDDRIIKAVNAFTKNCILTKKDHASGTDRVAEVAQKLARNNYKYIINVQGDEPCVQPEQIENIVKLLKKGAEIASLKKNISTKLAQDPNAVKVVCDDQDKALYFSRAAIPYARNGKGDYFKHVGLYGFDMEVLLELAQLPMSGLEKTEGLEQLRWVQAGYTIHCGTTKFESPSVDVPEDVDVVETFLAGVRGNAI